MSSRAYLILWCSAYYVTLAIISVSMPLFYTIPCGGEALGAYVMALPPAYWMISDAKLRGMFVPHILQPWIVLLWGFVVPIYLLATRKWCGLMYVALHYACIVAISMIGWYLSVEFVWPILFPESGW